MPPYILDSRVHQFNATLASFWIKTPKMTLTVNSIQTKYDKTATIFAKSDMIIVFFSKRNYPVIYLK